MAIEVVNPSFTIKRVMVDEIERKDEGGEGTVGNGSKKVFGGERDNLTWIDRDKNG
jgi:hypothetical protein